MSSGEDQPEVTVTLPFFASDDPQISCIFCRATHPCEFAIRVRRSGETAVMGIHATCVEPLQIRNRRSEAAKSYDGPGDVILEICNNPSCNLEVGRDHAHAPRPADASPTAPKAWVRRFHDALVQYATPDEEGDYVVPATLRVARLLAEEFAPRYASPAEHDTLQEGATRLPFPLLAAVNGVSNAFRGSDVVLVAPGVGEIRLQRRESASQETSGSRVMTGAANRDHGSNAPAPSRPAEAPNEPGNAAHAQVAGPTPACRPLGGGDGTVSAERVPAPNASPARYGHAQCAHCGETTKWMGHDGRRRCPECPNTSSPSSCSNPTLRAARWIERMTDEMHIGHCRISVVGPALANLIADVRRETIEWHTAREP